MRAVGTAERKKWLNQGNMTTRVCLPIFLILSVILLNFHFAETNNKQGCPNTDFHCGVLGTVGFPFFPESSSRPDCGLIKLDCGAKPYPHLHLYGKKYDVITKKDLLLHIVDRDLENLLTNNSCQTFYTNFSFPYSPLVSYEIFPNLTLFRCNLSSQRTKIIDFPAGFESYNKCSSHEAGGFTVFYKQHPYDDQINYGYVPPDNYDAPAGCTRIQLPIPINWENRPPHLSDDDDGPFGLVNASFFLERRLSVECYKCHDKGGRCIADDNNRFRCSKGKVDSILLLRAGKNYNTTISYHSAETGSNFNVVGTVGLAAAIVFAIFIVMCYKRRCHNSLLGRDNEHMLNNFLTTYGSLAPKRYSYSEVRKITESFKNQLGQGGYGCVYKGKMHDGRPVAVKVLKDLEGGGEEFLNEVASISRTSHVNIVTLKGFCFDGMKKALIYEFMCNGSLEKFIYENKSSTGRQLEWNVLYKIATGIARGLEYLHRGCNTRILHFDIKPHNILLDEDFCPKISDFGLAKLCMNKDSIVSVFGARGTIGYIAPEIVCRSFGGVSYKSDVYSYGMMVLEMAGGRKNFDVGVSCESEIYFPYWIHTRLDLDEELELTGITTEEENEYARKMIIVSLWCIQMDPTIRPSMSNVVEMLEGNLSNLKIPPKPYFSSPSRSDVYTSNLF